MGSFLLIVFQLCLFATELHAQEAKVRGAFSFNVGLTVNEFISQEVTIPPGIIQFSNVDPIGSYWEGVLGLTLRKGVRIGLSYRQESFQKAYDLNTTIGNATFFVDGFNFRTKHKFVTLFGEKEISQRINLRIGGYVLSIFDQGLTLFDLQNGSSLIDIVERNVKKYNLQEFGFSGNILYQFINQEKYSIYSIFGLHYTASTAILECVTLGVGSSFKF